MSAGAILVAAGVGQRLEADRPKAFVELAGAPLLLHAARALQAAESFASLVVVVPTELMDQAQEILAAADVTAVVRPGGRTRQASVASGLDATQDDVIAVHDAARALVSPALVRAVVQALTPDWDAAAPALAVVDTMKRIDPDDGRVLETVSRTTLRAVQTPQVFRRDLLERLHAEAHGADATDDLLLVEQAGGRVRLIDGDPRNFKITTPFDLALAAAMLDRPHAGNSQGEVQ